MAYYSKRDLYKGSFISPSASPLPCYSALPVHTPSPPAYHQYHSRLPQDDLMNIKLQFLRLLNEPTLRNLPAGWPFLSFFHGGELKMSYEPYEFKEHLSVLGVDGRLRNHSVRVSFTNPHHHAYNNMLAWRAYMPRLSSSGRGTGKNDIFAHVELDQRIMSTQYGTFLQNEGAVILRALAASLETSCRITIRLVDRSNFAELSNIHISSDWDSKNLPEVRIGGVVYISTDKHDRKRVMHTAFANYQSSK